MIRAYEEKVVSNFKTPQAQEGPGTIFFPIKIRIERASWYSYSYMLYLTKP